MDDIVDINADSEIKKFHMQMDVAKIRFTWIINNFREKEKKYGAIISDYCYTADANKKPSWILGLRRTKKNYFLMYLNMIRAENFKVRGSIKLSLLNDRDEPLTTHTLPTQNFNTHTKIDNFIDGTILDSLSNNSVVRISCEIDYTIHKFEDKERIELCANIKELFESKKFSDVQFSIKGSLFRAHKSILAARSDVFAKIFEQAKNEVETDCIFIYNIKDLVFDEMLHYIYTGTTTKLEELAMDLFVAGHNYALHGLKSMCEQELKSKLSCENVMEILILADQYKSVMLKSEAINFINKHSAVIVKSLQWQRIQLSHPHLIEELHKPYKQCN